MRPIGFVEYIYIYLIYINRVSERERDIFFCVISVTIGGIMQGNHRPVQFKSVNTMRFCPSYTMHGTF